MAMETWASPSETMFRLAIPPADAWLAALTVGTVLFQLLVMAAPTAYRAPDAEAVGKLIFTFSVAAAGAFFGASAFFSPPPQPTRAPTMNMAAKDALNTRFKDFLIFLLPLKIKLSEIQRKSIAPRINFP